MSSKRKPAAGKRRAPRKVKLPLEAEQKKQAASIWEVLEGLVARRNGYWTDIAMLEVALGEGFEEVARKVFEKGDGSAVIRVDLPGRPSASMAFPGFRRFHVATVDGLKPELRRYLEYRLGALREGLDFLEARLLRAYARGKGAFVELENAWLTSPDDVLGAARQSLFIAMVLRQCNRTALIRQSADENSLRTVIAGVDAQTPAPGYRVGRDRKLFSIYAHLIFDGLTDVRVQKCLQTGNTGGPQKAADVIVSRAYNGLSPKAVEQARKALK